MKTYITLLRGINVGGKNPVKMEALKELYEELGFRNVQTYIQSGNVVFQAPDGDLDAMEKRITGAIDRSFGYEVPVWALTREQLSQIAAQNPFAHPGDADPKHLHVTFLKGRAEPAKMEGILDAARGDEEVALAGNAVYLHCPHGYGTSKLSNNLIEKTLALEATTRNWRTVNKLIAMADAM